jgi:hypothetical protein
MRTTCTTKITLATNCQEKDKNSKELPKRKARTRHKPWIWKHVKYIELGL